MIETIDIKEASIEDRAKFFEHGIPKIASSGEPIVLNDSHVSYLIVDLKTSSGTYIKEFVHGDEDRTSPNLYTLLNATKADVLALDVSEIHMDWPNVPECKVECENEN